jgi:hypothetical protein
MYCYCYSGGLAFILGTISGGLKVALIVYLSNVVANLILAILLNLRFSIPKKDTQPISVEVSSEALIDSVNSAFRVMVAVCTMIVAFSVAMCLLDTLQVSSAIESILHRVFGVSNGVTSSVINAMLEISHVANLRLLGRYYLPTVSALFAFGGVCVVVQIVAIADKSFSLKRFLLCRLLASCVSFVVCCIMCKFLLNNLVAVGYVYQTKVTENSSVIPSISLLFMSFILLSKSTKPLYTRMLSL